MRLTAVILPYTLDELLRERREGAVRAIVRAVGYALARGFRAEDVGHFMYDSYRLAGHFQHLGAQSKESPWSSFVDWHLRVRKAWCDQVTVSPQPEALQVESRSMLLEHEAVLGFHGVTRMDMEACMETFWRLSGRAMGFDVTYTIGDESDWAILRAPGGAPASTIPTAELSPTPDALAAERRIGLAAAITFSIGYAKHVGDEPEEFGRFFYRVWDVAGHYDRLREQGGYGNALAYAQSLARSRQTLYVATELTEDLDGYRISSPSWASEIPQIMGRFGCLPDDVYRYYAGGGVPACMKLGLQYADQSDDRNHCVWIRSR